MPRTYSHALAAHLLRRLLGPGGLLPPCADSRDVNALSDQNAISWSSNRSRERPPWLAPHRSSPRLTLSTLAWRGGDVASPEHEHAGELEDQRGDEASALHLCEVNTASWSSRGSKASGLPLYVHETRTLSSVDRLHRDHEAVELSDGELANDADLNFCEVNTASWSSMRSGCGRYPWSIGRPAQHSSTFKTVQEVVDAFSLYTARSQPGECLPSSTKPQPPPSPPCSSEQTSPRGKHSQSAHCPCPVALPSEPGDDLPRRREGNLRWRLWAVRKPLEDDTQDEIKSVAAQMNPPLAVPAPAPEAFDGRQVGRGLPSTGLREAQSCGAFEHLAAAAEEPGPPEPRAQDGTTPTEAGVAAPVVAELVPSAPADTDEELVLVAIPKSRLEAVKRLLSASN